MKADVTGSPGQLDHQEVTVSSKNENRGLSVVLLVLAAIIAAAGLTRSTVLACESHG